MMTMPQTFHPATSGKEDRGRHADFKLRQMVSPLLSQAAAGDAGRPGKTRKSQPEGGKRFTSQAPGITAGR